MSGVDHRRRVIEDELDTASNTLQVYQEAGGRIQIALRVVVWEAGRLPDAVKREFDLARFAWADQFSYAEYGRLMANPQHRGGLRVLALILSVTRMLVEKHRIDFLLASCKPGLVGRYVQLGLRPYTTRLLEYPDGLEIPLMAPLDRECGARVRSPLRYIALHNHRLRQQCAGDLWAGGDPETAVVTDIRHVGLALDDLYERAPGPPLIDRAIVDDLVRSGSYVLSVNQRTKLIHEGLKDRDIYLVLEGEVVIETGVGRRAVATRGDVVGEFALFLPLHRRSKSAYARRAKILVIKQSALESLKARSPRRYIALIETLARRIIAKLADWEYASDEPLPRPLRQADP